MPVECVKCGGITTDDITPITCSTCRSSYHPNCVEVKGGAIINCNNCSKDDNQSIPPAPKGNRRKTLSANRSVSKLSEKSSKSSHKEKDERRPESNLKKGGHESVKSGSNRSSKSSKSIQKELELLELQRSLEIQAQEELQIEREKLFAEKEKFIKAKLATDLKYLKQKTLLENELEDHADDSEADSVTSSQLAKDRVEKWQTGNVRPKAAHGIHGDRPNQNAEHFEKFKPPQGSSTFNIAKHTPIPTTSRSNVATLTMEQWTARKSDMRNLPAFTGEPKEWPVFIKQFEQSTQLCGFDDIDNIVRLRTSLKGNARKVVESALCYAENVNHIITTLSQLFGRPEFILNDLLKDVRQLPYIKPDRFEDIIHMSIIVANICSTMVAAAMSDHLWNPMLLQELVNKLPVQLKREWAQYRIRLTSASIETFKFWLSERSLEYSCLLTEPPSFIDSRIRKNAVNIHSIDRCGVCAGQCSTVAQCMKFVELPYKEKWSWVKDLQLCRMCLKKHKSRCTASKVCGINDCPYRHHPKLHKTNEDNIGPSQPAEMVNSHSSSKNPGILFKILPVTLHNADKVVNTYALLDDGSSVTLVERWVADALNVDGIVDELCLKWTGDTHKTETDSLRFSVKVSGSSMQQLPLCNARTVGALNLPVQTIDAAMLLQEFTHLRGIPIQSYENIQPSILIGLDNVKLITCFKLKEGDSNEPVAAKTRLGWVVFGGCDAAKYSCSYHTCQCSSNLDSEMDRTLKNFIALENLLTEHPTKTLIPVEDERALKIMKATTKYLGDRYEIGLIWRFDKFTVPNSYAMAFRRLTCLERSLAKNDELKQNLKSQIEEYVEKGYAEKLDLETIDVKTQSSWYLPIFAVRNPNKPTKVRIVWDAASEVDNISLNTLLLKGPDLLSNLPGVLFRFRQFNTAIAGDIKQMFHQIRIREEDRPFLRFLWRDSPACKVDTYQMKVMIFGASCAPSCSQFIKNTNADRFSNEMPLAVAAIKNNHYVDDWLESVESEQEAMKLIEQVRTIHASGGFEICNFLSNSSFVLENSPNVNSLTSKMFHEDGDTSEKLLGMWWEIKTDSFIYSLKYHKVDDTILTGIKMPTKRQILKLLMSIFDPLGLISHLLIFPKILMQEVWKSGINWDEVIPESLQSKWMNWVKELPKVETIRIPRWYGLTSSDQVELHVFVDASRDAFAAACYLRSCSQSKVVCTLISAKTKVAPLKLLSIPRLELSAAVLGCRLATSVIKTHTIKFKKVTFWTDSKTVWCWLNSDHRNYKQYVAFRVAEILETTDSSQWRWVPSNLNIADKATRQVISSEEDSFEWFSGPSFLHQPTEDDWPKNLTKTENETEELRSHVLHNTVVHHCRIEFTRFSKWNRLTRSLAYVRRFIFNVRASKTNGALRTGPLKKEEIQIAENDCFKIAQHDEYIDEIADLKAGRTVSRKSPLYKLTPYMDANGVLRSKSRLECMINASEDFIRPIILPNRHYIVMLLIQYYHEKYKHQNHDTSLHEIQQKFHINSLRTISKTIRNSCQLCKNRKAVPVVPIMGNLPRARLSPFTQPFSFIGIDYFGPYFVAVGRHREKRWGVLITCLNTRAVHLDISETLTTDSCICAIKRFISRRGEPLEIFSDQGTNFKGTNNELKAAILKLNQNELASRFTTSTLQWHFNPPLAPHMGGVWERLVRAVKSAIEYALSSTTRTPREELLRTMVCEAEFVVNSRPLTYIPLDSEASDVLTPNHFIMGSSNGIKTFGVSSDDPAFLQTNWKRSNQLIGHFWKRWIREYLPIIRRRSKWFDDVRELEVGDIVVIIEDNYERHLWKKAKVIDVSKSRDGHVRKATVQTANNNIYERAVAKLAVLDVRKDNANASTLDSDALPGGSVASNNSTH